MNDIGLTPLGEALIRIEKVLVEGNKLENYDSPELENVLKEIRKEERSQFDWVPGYAGAWRAQRRWT